MDSPILLGHELRIPGGFARVIDMRMEKGAEATLDSEGLWHVPSPYPMRVVITATVTETVIDRWQREGGEG